MEIDISDILGVEDLIILVSQARRHFPTKGRNLFQGSVGKLHAGFKQSLVWFERNADHPLHSLKGVMFGQPDNGASIGMTLNLVICRHKGGRPVMEGPVEFHAARDP